MSGNVWMFSDEIDDIILLREGQCELKIEELLLL